MADRSISVRLRAETADFNRQIDNTAQRTNTAAQRIEASSVKVETARKRERDATAQVEAAEKRLADTKARGTASARQIENAEKQVTQARNAQKGATEALTAAEKRHAEVAGTATTSLGRLAQSANQNADAWNTAGTALLGAGAAVTGLGVAALKTGIDYNTLQQQSRAALTTLLGGAEAANAQMDKLDAFARTSPFSKSTFITAQQQLLAFGVTADQVVPTLQAIQDAVAAAGGSNQQLSELVFVLAQIQAAGKITGQDLIQFGQRGVDAATLIGSQMGKTGEQIRSDITAGSLDAGTAISALTAGMEQKFGGAAGNVKKTFLGATDRVKSAWRDLSSELAEGLVGKDGGGALGSLANRAADAMRDFQALPGPVKASGAALGAVTAAGLLTSGMFLTLAPRIVSTRVAMATLRTEMPRASRAFTTVSKSMLGIGGAAAGILAASEAAGILINILKTGEAEQGANELEKSVRDLAKSGDISNLNAQFQNWGKVLGANVNDVTDLGGALREALAPSVQDSMANLVGHLPGVTSYTEDVRTRFAALDTTLSGMVNGGSADEAAVAFGEIQKTAASLGFSTEKLNTLFPQYSDALVGATTDQTKAKTAGEQLAESMGYVGDMSEDSAKALQSWRDKVIEADSTMLDSQGAYDAVIQKNKDLAQSTADATKSSKDSWEDYYDGVSVSMGDLLAEMQKQIDAQSNWHENLLGLADRVKQELPPKFQESGKEMLEALELQGADGASLVATLSSSSDAEFAKYVKKWGKQGSEAKDAWRESWEAAIDPVPKFKSAKEAQAEFLHGLLLNPGTIPVTADTTDAERAVANLRAAISNSSIPNYVEVSATRPSRFSKSLNTGLPRSPFADGGAITGGTPGVDSVPILTMPGEHVWTTAEVNQVGGQGAMYRMRALARAGALPKYASGGAVGYLGIGTPSATDSASIRTARLKAALRAATAEEKAAQKAYDAIDSSKANHAKKVAAKADLAQAKADAKAAQKAYDAAKSSVATLRGYASDLASDKRLGSGIYAKADNPGDAISNALSNASSLLDWADSGAFSKAATAKMRKTAKSAQVRLTKAQDKLSAATDTLSDITSAYDSLRGSLTGGFSLSGMLGSTDTYGWSSIDSAHDIATSAQAYAGKLKSLGSKVADLRKKGASQALIEQITALDVDEALQVADAFLADQSAITATSSALSQIDTNANAVGLAVVSGMTGAAAMALYTDAGGQMASGLVDSLAKNVDSIGSSIAVAITNAMAGKGSITTKKATKKTAKKKALGGAVYGSEPYLVGEQGPELFVPNVSGQILTAPATSAALSGSTVSAAQVSQADLVRALSGMTLIVNAQVGVDRKTSAELVVVGAHENQRTGNPQWRSSTGQVKR